MSLIKHIMLPLALAGTLAAPLAAQANTWNFKNSSLFDSVSSAPNFNSGDLGVTVRGYKENGSLAQVARSNKGLGVQEGGLFSSGDLEGGEKLVLSFSQAVQLTSLTLTGWDTSFSPDKATLSWAGGSISLGGTNSLVHFFPGTSTFTFADALAPIGSIFTLQGLGSNTEFRLAGLSASVAPVPEASSFALMGVGLVGMAFVARRRRAQA